MFTASCHSAAGWRLVSLRQNDAGHVDVAVAEWGWGMEVVKSGGVVIIV